MLLAEVANVFVPLPVVSASTRYPKIKVTMIQEATVLRTRTFS